MSKTPRTDGARIEMIYDMIYHDNEPYFGQIARSDKMAELETELDDMREMFREYVKAEDKWMESLSSFCSEGKRNQLRIKACELREKAKEVLGL